MKRAILNIPLCTLSACTCPSEQVPPGGGGSASSSATATATAAPADESSDEGASSVDFIAKTDAPLAPLECSTFQDDCPHGQKCNAFSFDGSANWNALRCFPIVANPDAIGESCTVEESGVSGSDSCERGAMCWDVDGDSGLGTCVEHCQGSYAQPVCSDPLAECSVHSDGVPAICLPSSDPRDTTCGD